MRVVFVSVLPVIALLSGCVTGQHTSTTAPPESHSTSTNRPTNPSNTEATTVPAASTNEPVITSTPETIAADEMTIYEYRFGVGYSVIEFGATASAPPVIIDEAASDLSELDSSRGPGNALILRFANFADRVAFWTSSAPGELRISDKALTSSQVIFVDSDNKYRVASYPYPSDEIELLWSPDDLHLIVDVPNDRSRNLIYHMQTADIAPWPYICDSIAKSSKTSRWALLCTATDSGTNFAVIEWGGEIWYSDAPLSEVLVKNQTQSAIWAWSADGERIAFFDPADNEGLLHIVDQTNTHITILPGAAYWFSDVHPILLPPKRPLQWSQDGHRLLIYAISVEPSVCPKWRNIFAETSDAHMVPCWQVVEPEMRKVIWGIGNSSIELTGTTEPLIIQAWSYYDAIISPNGESVAVAGISGGLDKLFLVEVATSSVVAGWDASIGSMTWSTPP